MTMTAMVDIPPELARLLADFCDAKKTGTVQFDVMQGKIEAWRITETGRVDRRKT